MGPPSSDYGAARLLSCVLRSLGITPWRPARPRATGLHRGHRWDQILMGRAKEPKCAKEIKGRGSMRRAFSPWGESGILFLGRCPRLVWGAPVAAPLVNSTATGIRNFISNRVSAKVYFRIEGRFWTALTGRLISGALNPRAMPSATMVEAFSLENAGLLPAAVQPLYF